MFPEEEIIKKYRRCLNKLCSIHTIEYYALKMNDLQVCRTIRMNLTNIILVERSQTQKVHILCTQLYAIKKQTKKQKKKQSKTNPRSKKST